MKESYQSAKLTVTEFKAEDVIATSTTETGTGGTGTQSSRRRTYELPMIPTK